MKILAPFSLYLDFGCHFGCHPNGARPDQIYLHHDSIGAVTGMTKDSCAAAANG